MGRKPDNPVSRLRPKEKLFLKRYVLGEVPHKIAADLWPEVPGGPVFKAAQIMQLERFEDALAFITDPLLSRNALALRQLQIADTCKQDNDKISAIRAASQALGGQIPIRNSHRVGSRVGKPQKTQKNRLPPLPEDELQAKLQALAEKAGLDGYSSEKTN